MQTIIDTLRFLWHPDLILLVQRIFGPRWRLVFETLSLLGGAQITLVAVAWARWFRARELAARLLLALFLGIGVDLLIWNLFPTPRPDDPRIRISSEIPISSFPSGHLVTVLTLWGTLAAMGVLPRWTVAALAFAVALSRLGLGEHYPGDVLGGMLVGLIILGIVAWLWPRLLRFFAARPWPQPLLMGAAVAALAVLATPLTPPGRWQLLGILAGVALGLPLEARAVGFDTACEGWRDWLRRLGIGVVGLLPLTLAATALHHTPLVAQWLVPFLAALWIVLGVPATLRRLADQPAQRDTAVGAVAPLRHGTGR